MALVNPYCSIEQVADELRNSDATLAAPAGQLELAINQVSRFIDDYKGRDYYLHDHSVTSLKLDQLDISKGIIVDDTIWLPYWPIITWTSLTVSGELWVEDT